MPTRKSFLLYFGCCFIVKCLRKKKKFDNVSMSNESFEVSVKGVMPTSNGCAIFLGNDQKTFVIYVDPAIGNAINMTINQVKKRGL